MAFIVVVQSSSSVVQWRGINMGLIKNSSTGYARLNPPTAAAAETTTFGGKVRKGYVPVLVGREEEKMEKVWLPTKLIAHPRVVALLNTSADEFGYSHHQGLLRITHDVAPFKSMIQSISTHLQGKRICMYVYKLPRT